MSREWLMVMRCDVCGETIEEDDENNVTLFFSETATRMPERMVDLCDTHGAQLTWLAEASRPIMQAEKNVDRPPLAQRGRERQVCPFCNGEYTMGSGIAIHVKEKHPKYYRPKTDWSKVTFDGKQMVG